MRTRVCLDGFGEIGPVWVWTDSVAAVFSNEESTLIALVGGSKLLGVTESVDEVLEAIDTAESSAAASAAGMLA